MELLKKIILTDAEPVMKYLLERWISMKMWHFLKLDLSLFRVSQGKL